MAGKPSLMEIKRQQWAREREEAQSDWCPWGRPGGGAPLKWHRTSDRNDARMAPHENKKDVSFLPPLNAYHHHQQHPPQAKPVTPTPGPLPLPPPPPPRDASRPRRSPRNFSQTDGETSGYHSDNHHVDPATNAARHNARHRHEPLQPAMPDHQLQQVQTSRSFHVPPQTSVSEHHYLQLLPQGSFPIPPHTSHSEHYHHHGHDQAGMPRADYKFLERRKWIQDGTIPYDLYGENPPHGAQDRTAPPRWVVRPHQSLVQSEPPLSDRTVRDPKIHHNGPATAATAAAPNFLRGQNVVLDATAIAERDAKRAKAAELQRILLQQLAEKENQKMLERKKQEEYERRQEEELSRQIEIERRQIEEERRRAQEKKEVEERRMAAVREAIAGAQENALAEKAARKRAMHQTQSTSMSSSEPPATALLASDEMSSAAPARRPADRHRSYSPEPCRLVDTAVQTEQSFKHVCQCDNKSRSHASPRIPATASERGRPATQMSMRALKSQSSNNSIQSRPRWNANQTNAKYQSQTEKDPRFLNRRRDRVRRRQKLLLEKQLHGSWPSSENSGSQEDMGDTFFPVLPGSGAADAAHERYYEAHQAAPVNQYKRAPVEKSVPNHQHQHQHHHHHHHKAESRIAVVEPPFMPPDPPKRPTSPPVPALLKKLQMLNGEKHELENDHSIPETGKDSKMEKELENQQIREQHGTGSEEEKEDLLFRLSLLKKGLEKMRADLDAVSITSSN